MALCSLFIRAAIVAVNCAQIAAKPALERVECMHARQINANVVGSFQRRIEIAD
jgi:hypothetical protein